MFRQTRLFLSLYLRVYSVHMCACIYMKIYVCMYVCIQNFRNFSKLKFIITSIALLYCNAKKRIVLQDNIRTNFVRDLLS